MTTSKLKKGVSCTVALLLYLVSLQTGEAHVKSISSQLERHSRTLVLFRVLGDDSIDWAEAAASWGERSNW
jgi:hypothetical protein